MENSNLNMTELLYKEEHVKCLHYVSDKRCFFKHYTLVAGEKLQLSEISNNHIMFILEGSMIIYDAVKNDKINIDKQQITFIPQYASETLFTNNGCQLLICSFDTPLNICDKLIFNEIHTDKTADYQPLPIREPMLYFINLLLYYLQNKINCEHLHEIKQKEMFLIFKWFYTKNELAQLFHLLNSKNYEFRRLVMENYEKASDVANLAALAGMRRTRFDVKFNEEFGIPPRQWMLKQLARKVQYAVNEPGVTIDMLIRKFNFNSPVSFIRFCKVQFGYTPKELISKKHCKLVF